jgi:GNAT superfamily N-acetyltransferase
LEFEIRRLSAQDAVLFDRISPEVFDDDVDPARLAAYLAEPGHLMIVALAGGEIVGQTAAVIHRHPDNPTELYVDEVGVTPELWRRGVARRMLEAMFAWGVELGCEEAWVGTEPDNGPARALYEAFGESAVPIVMYEYDPLPGQVRRP